MKTRLYYLVSILCVAAMLLAVVAPLTVTADSPVKVPLGSDLAAPDSALAAKQEAIRLVETMQYPDPDVTPPGKDFRKEYILLELRASIDGTFSSDNFLENGAAFEDALAGRVLCL